MSNQLFNTDTRPSKDLANQLVIYCGLTGLGDKAWFSIKSMKEHNSVQRVKENMFDDLKKVYKPCKAKSYLNESTPSSFNEKSLIVVLRQILRAHKICLLAKSKCHQGTRFQIYRIDTCE